MSQNPKTEPKKATKLFCPWDSPGKNTGIGCHALFKGIFLIVGIKPTSLMSPALTGRFFTTSSTWEAQHIHTTIHKIDNQQRPTV